MNNKEILDLVNIFENSTLSRMKLERDDFSLTLERATAQTIAQTVAVPMQPMQMANAAGNAGVPGAAALGAAAGTTAGTAGTASTADQAAADDAAQNKAENLIQVKAPLVGVYYAAPSPDELPYVKVGDKVEKGQVLCLVEAMKMMNELKAPAAGTIRSAKGVNGQLVEFDQVLFEVEPC